MSYGINAPVGFRPTSYVSGAPWTGKFSYYLIEGGYNTSIFQGDLVSRVAGANGYIKKLLPTEINGGNGAPALGVFLGCEYVTPGAQSNITPVTNSPYWPANQAIKAGTVVYAKVIDDSEVIYDVQTNGTVNLASMGGNASFALGAGSTVTGLSGEVIDVGTISKAASFRASGASTLTGTVNLVIPAVGITANSLVMLTRKTAGGGAGNLTITIQPGVSFTVVSSNGADNSAFNYQVLPGTDDNSFLPLKLLYATQVPGNTFDPITGAGILNGNIFVILNNSAYRVGTQGV